MDDPPRQLFMPGTGQLPPYFAGREHEQRTLLDCLGVLREGGTVPADIVLTGPRGNGKTALLRWFDREIVASRAADAISLTPVLRREGCLPVASAVARAFASQASTSEERTLTDEGLDRAIGTALAGADGEAKQAAATRLRELGYIWQPSGKIDWEPGIPSLMGYVLNPRTVRRSNT